MKTKINNLIDKKVKEVTERECNKPVCTEKDYSIVRVLQELQKEINSL